MLDKLEKELNKFDLSDKQFVDVRYAYSAGESVTVRNGRFDSISNLTMGGIAVRALINNAWGFTTTVNTDSDSIHEAIKKAINIAEISSKYAKQERAINPDWVFEGKGQTKLKIDPRDIDKDTKFEKLILTEKTAREYSNKIAQAVISYIETHNNEFIINNRGTRVENETHSIRLMKNITGREGQEMQNVFDSIGGTGGWELIKHWDPEKEGLEAAQMAEKLLTAKNPPSGKMNIIMDPSLTGVFIHEAFGHACEADAIIAETSILAGKIGQQVGVEGITIIDDPTLPGLRGSFEYDSEGTKAKKRYLVKQGVLKEYFQTLETATALGADPNGSGRAQNFNSPPLARMGNTYVDEGELTLEELIEETQNGVYLKSSYGGYVSPAKGQFYFTCQMGHYIENGELTDLMGNVGMSGMTLDVLQNAYGVSKKWEPSFLGTCGKGGQWIPVTGGGPNIGVSDLVVGGR